MINLNNDSINLKKADGKLFGGFVNTSATVLYENLSEYNGKIIFKNIKVQNFLMIIFYMTSLILKFHLNLLLKVRQIVLMKFLKLWRAKERFNLRRI